MNPASANGVVFSDVSQTTSYSIILQIALVNSYPQITIGLSQSESNTVMTFPSYTCKNAAVLNS
jgi:hypothetical protein